MTGSDQLPIEKVSGPACRQSLRVRCTKANVPAPKAEAKPSISAITRGFLGNINHFTLFCTHYRCDALRHLE
jgi:hypothetical protein